MTATRHAELSRETSSEIESLLLAAKALEAGRSAFAALERAYHRHDYDHDRDQVWQAACAWASDEGIAGLSGRRPDGVKVLSGTAAVIWHAFVQGWCDAADSADIDPIQWGCSWNRAAREWV